MKKIITISHFFFFIYSSYSQINYQTFCEIKDGRAYGYIHNFSDAFEIDGNVLFYLFDNQNQLVGSKDEYEYEYVWGRSTEEIEHTTVSSSVCICQFDIIGAIKNQTPSIAFQNNVLANNPNYRYQTSCEIKNGRAYGYIHNFSEALEIDGNVLFYLFNNKNQLIGFEDEYEYEYVSRKSTEEIEYTNVSANACKCQFDISGAIRK